MIVKHDMYLSMLLLFNYSISMASELNEKGNSIYDSIIEKQEFYYGKKMGIENGF
jgi:hypothetical protein